MKKTTDPQISVNKLAEFIGAKAPRQRAILRDQKYPRDFKTSYYREASEAICLCLASAGDDTAVLDRTIARLEQYAPESMGTQRRISANIDALENFRLMLDDVFPLAGDPTLGDHSAAKLSYFNIRISVRPDIILGLPSKSGSKTLGAIKLHFPKTFSLTDEAAGLVSAVLQEWFKCCRSDDGSPIGEHCYVIDVGTRRVCRGAKSVTARMKEVRANCQNIAALWPTILEDE